MPYSMDFVEEVGGTPMVETFRQNRIGEIRMSPSAWHNMSREQRQHQLRWRRPLYALPTKLVQDRATSMLPRLLYRCMDELGVDFSVLYPTLGLDMLFIKNDEVRHAACRALNKMNANVWAEFSDWMAPVAAIPQMRELNIGHFLMGESLFVGLDAAISRMRDLMDRARNP